MLPIRQATLFALLFNVLQLAAQAPEVDFNKYHYSPYNPLGVSQTQNNSGEDWYYDLTTAKKGGKDVGYICAGYSTYRNLFGANGSCGTIPLPTNYDGNDMDIPGTLPHGYPVSTLTLVSDKGDVIWFQNYPANRASMHGRFYNVVQAPDESFIAVGSMGYADGIKYNPNASFPTGQALPCNDQRMAYVVKTDVNGNVLWQYYYGNEANLTTASQYRSAAYAITPKGTTGNYLITVSEGYNTISLGLVIIEIDANGLVVQKNKISVPMGYSYWGTPLYFKGRSLLYESATGNTFVAGTFCDIGTGYGSNQKGIAFVMKLNSSLAQVASYNKVNMSYDVNGNSYDNLAFDLEWFTTSPPTFLASFLVDGPGAAGGENGTEHADGVVEKINTSLSVLAAVNIGQVTATDLQIGVTKTSDNGFAVVSTKMSSLLTNCANPFSPYNTSRTCTSGVNLMNNYEKKFWNTNAYVAKYNSSMAFQWDKVISENTPPASYGSYSPPSSYGNIGDPRLQGDLKREECLYKIVESPNDGGLVICGNNSNNIDDDLIIKLHSNCQKMATVDITSDLNINTSVTWNNTPHAVQATINIQAGGTLTISGSASVIEFCDTRQVGKPVRIVVQPGGKLILSNGAKLTGILSCPNSEWEGVTVLGNPSLSQLPETNQGVVEITSATIEHARNALTAAFMLYATNPLGVLDYSLTMVPFPGVGVGGIIKCTSANLTNNGTSARLMPYTNFNTGSPTVEVPNRSFFTSCNFIVNNSMNKSLPFSQFVYMNGVGGLNFRGNKFENNKTGVDNVAAMGYGIYSVDAGYNVLPYCTAYNLKNCVGEIRSNFKNLEYGIRATRISSTRTFLVDKSDFDGNVIAVKSEAISNITVKNSTFSIGNSPVAISTNTGVFIEGNCINYAVTGNAFNRASTPNGTSVSYGVNVANSGTSDNKIEKNTYNQLAIANSSVYINRNSSGPSGLQFLCNTYSQTSMLDQIAFDNSGGTTDGIRAVQGTAAIGAGNKFSSPPPPFGTVGHFWNIPPASLTYYYGTGTNENPSNVSSNVIRTGTGNATCQDGGGGGGGMLMAPPSGLSQEDESSLENEYMASYSNYVSYMQQLEGLQEDGGSEALEQRSLLEADMFYYKDRADNVAHEAISRILGDTAGLNHAKLRHWLTNLNTKESDYEIAASYTQQGDFANALSTINSITENRVLSEAELIEHNAIKDVYGILATSEEEGRPIDSLNEEDLNTLYAIADGKPCKAMSIANAILRTYYGRKFETYPPLPEEPSRGEHRSYKSENKGGEADATSGEVIVYPNPTKELLFLDFHQLDMEGAAAITVYDILGQRLVRQDVQPMVGNAVIDARSLPAGCYLYEISASNLRKTGRFSVTK